MTIKNVILAVLVLLIVSCANEDEFSVEPEFFEDSITIESGLLLTYDLGNFPIEGGVTIHQQSDHHEVSEIIHAEIGGLEYRYLSKAGFTGTDYIEIKHTYSSGGMRIENIAVTQLTILVE